MISIAGTCSVLVSCGSTAVAVAHDVSRNSMPTRVRNTIYNAFLLMILFLMYARNIWALKR
jgi:hypothetical protein